LFISMLICFDNCDQDVFSLKKLLFFQI